MQRQGGGGNNPSCGCDMQAGWPPASEFPRGGIQGGGRRIEDFKLQLRMNNGTVQRYKGTRNNNNNNTSSARSLKKMPISGKPYYVNKKTRRVYTMLSNGKVGNNVGTLKVKKGKKTIVSNSNSNSNSTTSKMTNEYNFASESTIPKTPMTPPYGPMTPPYGPMTPPYGPMTPPYGPMTPPYGPKTPKTPKTPPYGPKTPKTPPYSPETPNYNTDEFQTPLSQEGGAKKRRTHTRKCGCFLCSFKKLKLLSRK